MSLLRLLVGLCLLSAPSAALPWEKSANESDCHFRQAPAGPNRKFMSLTLERSLFMSDDRVFLYFRSDGWKSLMPGKHVPKMLVENGNGSSLDLEAQAATSAIFFEVPYLEAVKFLGEASRVSIWRENSLVESFSVDGISDVLVLAEQCHARLINQRNDQIDPFAG